MTERNTGISLLKLIMCFGVITCHYWTPPLDNMNLLYDIQINIGLLAVPVFMLIAFIYTDVPKLSSDNKSFINRLKRLYIPQIVWSIVPFVYWSIYGLIFNEIIIKRKISLLWQMITGHVLYLSPQMWFQFALILLTFTFVVLYKFISKKVFSVILILLMLFSFYLQYTGISLKILDGFSSELYYPLGRMIEMIPYAVAGIVIKQTEILECINKKIFTCVVMLVLVIAFYKYGLPKRLDYGFGYQGIIFFFLAIVVVILFYYLPLNFLSAEIRNTINRLSRYTVGIYGMHILIGKNLTRIIDNHESIGKYIRSYSIKECIIIYIICLLLSYLLDKTNIKILKDSVT